jgi:hypothetical protein
MPYFSVCPHITIQDQLKGFFLNRICYLEDTTGHVTIEMFVEAREEQWTVYLKTYTAFLHTHREQIADCLWKQKFF